MKSMLRQNLFLRKVYYLFVCLRQYLSLKPLILFKQYCWYINQLHKLNKLGENKNFGEVVFYPCLFDNTSQTPLDPTYFFQDTWAAKKIFELKPNHHIDVGSSVKTLGILSQFIPVTLVDIRPIELKLNNLSFKEGSILNLPFEDNSVDSLSSLCVVEHIGLGRYGDELDPNGSEKAIKEIHRILKPGGILLFSVPVDDKNKIYFNAHRAFTRDYILSLLNDFSLIEEKYHYGNEMFDSYDVLKGFGTGLFMLKKNGN